jgi:hypothetical protein
VQNYAAQVFKSEISVRAAAQARVPWLMNAFVPNPDAVVRPETSSR